MLEKTLERSLDCKEIQPVHPKGDQSWVFIGGTDVEAETPVFGHIMRRTDSFEKTAVSELVSLEGDMKNGICPGEPYILEILPSPIINTLFLKRSSRKTDMVKSTKI